MRRIRKRKMNSPRMQCLESVPALGAAGKKIISSFQYLKILLISSAERAV